GETVGEFGVVAFREPAHVVVFGADDTVVGVVEEGRFDGDGDQPDPCRRFPVRPGHRLRQADDGLHVHDLSGTERLPVVFEATGRVDAAASFGPAEVFSERDAGGEVVGGVRLPAG